MDKDNKNKFWKGALVGALVTAFAGLIMVCVAMGIFVVGRSVMRNPLAHQNQTQTVESSSEAQTQELDMDRVEQKVGLLERVIDRYFLFDIDGEKMESGIYKGLLEGLDDPYSVYYTPEEYQAMTEETEGTYCGIGVLVSQNIETGIITILRVFPGSPAEEAGMKKGDILYMVGDLAAMDEELDVLVSQHIRGEEGTYVDLTVLRGNEEVPIHVQRRMVEVATVESQMLENNVGYILVTQFDLVTADQFKEAVDTLTSQGMEKMIIDLRDNPGGVVDPCVEMAAYLLPEDQFDGTIISIADKDGQTDRYYCEDGELLHETKSSLMADNRYPVEDNHEVDMPIAILINGQSASAAEVFAGAMRDYGRATLVGTTSFGKGIVQSLLPLDDGSAVKITTAHYYTPAGTDLHQKGLEPDVEVEYEVSEDLAGEYDIPLDKDNQVQKAVEVLEKE